MVTISGRGPNLNSTCMELALQVDVTAPQVTRRCLGREKGFRGLRGLGFRVQGGSSRLVSRLLNGADG